MVDGVLDDVDIDNAIGTRIGRAAPRINGHDVESLESLATAESMTNPAPVAPSRRRIHRTRPGTGDVDRAAGQRAVVQLLTALGRDPVDEHLADTPRRVVDALIELTTPQDFDFTTFPNDEGYDEMVIVRNIPVRSLCEHHLLPFSGRASIGYLPGERIVGLSKLARIVEHFACRPQTQERLTKQVAQWLQDHLSPQGVGVIVEAEHSCMTLRGAHATGSSTLTSTLLGQLRDDPRSRQEFLALADHGRA